MLLRSADALARAARAADAAELAARALAIEPVSEGAFRAVIRCMALAGDRAGALELADRFEARLAELDAEPGQETRAMVERILDQLQLRLRAIEVSRDPAVKEWIADVESGRRKPKPEESPMDQFRGGGKSN